MRRRTLLNCAGEHGGEMAAGAGEHEQMPDKMIVAPVLIDKKHNAERVSDTASHKPRERELRNELQNRPQRDDAEPAHSEIQTQRQLPVTRSAARGFQYHSKNGQRPDRCENCKPPRAMQRAERNRRVRSGDQ